MMLQTPFIQISSSIFSLDTFAPTASMDLGVVSIDPLGTGVTMNAGGYFRAGESPLVPGAKNIVFDPSTGLFKASAVAIASGRYNGIIDTSVNLPAISSVSESVFWGKKAKANVLQAMTSSFIGGPYLLTSEVLPNTSASIDTTIPGSLVIHSGSTYGTIFEAGTFTHVIGGTSVTPFTAHSTIAQTSSSLQGNTPGPGFDVWLRSSPAEALLINFSPGDQLVGGQITVAMPWRIHEFNSVNPSYHCQITGYVSASWSQPSVSSSIPPTDYSASFADSAVVTTAGIYGSTGFVTLNNIMPGPNNTVYLSFIYNFVTGLL